MKFKNVELLQKTFEECIKLRFSGVNSLIYIFIS